MGKHIIIKRARCSFPQLYKEEVKGDQKFNPGITLLLSKADHKAEIAELSAEIKAAIEGNAGLKKQPPKGERLCLRSDESNGWRPEYPADHLLLRAGNKTAPVVLHKDMRRMTEADNAIYSGCYVNVKVELWAQDNPYGKRVNAKLLAVQFCDDGESFDAGHVDAETAVEGFGSIDDGKDALAGLEDLPF